MCCARHSPPSAVLVQTRSVVVMRAFTKGSVFSLALVMIMPWLQVLWLKASTPQYFSCLEQKSAVAPVAAILATFLRMARPPLACATA
jgi:hypothetical protein